MKVYKTTKNILYKYNTWTQPVFSSNTLTQDGVWYKLTASREQASTVRAWKAFDGSTAGQNCWWTGGVTVNEANPAWICLECDHKLKLTNIWLKGDTNGAENPKSVTIQVSNNGTSWTNVGSCSFASNAAGLESSTSLNVSEGYRFYRVYCTSKYADGVAIGEIKYTGQIAKEVTSGSYDFSVSRDVYKTLKTNGVYRAY